MLTGKEILFRIGVILVFGGMLCLLIPTAKAEGALKPINIVTVKPTPPEMVTLTVPMTFEGDDIAIWEGFSDGLGKTAIPVITFKVQGYGGIVLVANEFAQAVSDAVKAGKIINMDIIGPSYSAHAFITCYASKVSIREGAGLMFHSVAVFRETLFGLIQYADSATDPTTAAAQDTMFNQCISKGILTPIDVKYIKADGDVFITNVGGKILKTYMADPYRGTKLLSDAAFIVFLLSIALVLIGLAKRI